MSKYSYYLSQRKDKKYELFPSVSETWGSHEVPLIEVMSSGGIFRNSSHWDSNHVHYQLHYTTGTASWSARVNDQNQWAELEPSSSISGLVTWVAVSTQGRGDMDQRVTQYKVKYSLDGVTWSDYNSGEILTGNTDRNTVITNYFNPSIVARRIRICPFTWQWHVSLRLDAYIYLKYCNA